MAEFAGLGSGAGHEDFFSKERAAVEPGERVSQVDDTADDGHGGGFKLGAVDFIGDGFDGAGDDLLAGGGGPADEGDGRGGVEAGGDELTGDGAHALDAHEHDFSAGGAGDGRIIEGGWPFGWVFVAGEEGELGIERAMGDWDAGVSGAGNGGADARHDFEGHAGGD